MSEFKPLSGINKNMLTSNPPREEFEARLAALFSTLRRSGHRFDTALIIDRINQYYFTGTMQDGILVLRRDGEAFFFVRKSYDRALFESPLDIIRPMNSYRDLLQFLPADLGSTFIETEVMPLAVLERLRKYFTISVIQPLEGITMRLRSVKSKYELDIMRESGRQHNYLLQQIIPGLLRAGISEAELQGEVYNSMIQLGYHGVSRFAMFQAELIAGQVSFAESGIFPTSFNGPGGGRGASAAIPTLGSRDRLLQRGDIILLDIGYGINGYHTDKTQVYCFGAEPPKEAVEVHQACLDVLNRASAQLVIGAVPAKVYQNIMAELPAALQANFMGYGREQVKFLGHSIGLQIDEQPVIARGFNEPLKPNMAFALEPKSGIAGIGMVGAEETYLVTPEGPECITGGAKEIMVVDYR
ncbi:MAG: aminopeptidase P family protein [Ruminococcaceae bacterium]|nr:aminopeptidase P family protein [Oscillospiraceae bacterium]